MEIFPPIPLWSDLYVRALPCHLSHLEHLSLRRSALTDAWLSNVRLGEHIFRFLIGELVEKY